MFGTAAMEAVLVATQIAYMHRDYMSGPALEEPSDVWEAYAGRGSYFVARKG